MLRRCPLRISPEKWHVTPAVYNAAIRVAAQKGHAGNKEIEFLCAKNVENLPVMHDGKVVDRFDLIVSPPANSEWVDRRKALLDIVGLPSGSGKVGTFQEIPEGISFASFVKVNPQWDKDKSWVFFRDHPAVKDHDVAIQRVQIFGSCAIHTPVTLSHYLTALGTHGKVKRTLDMPLWLRKHASSEILEGIVFGKGAVSTAVLSSILIPDPSAYCAITACTQIPSQLPSMMEKYGPGLVASWRVASDFYHPGPHLGAAPVEIPVKKDPRHSMLVVGHRCTEEGQLRLLLQNWWESKQFVEVDEEYFKTCNTYQVVFVVTPQTAFRADFDVTGDTFAVCAADGAGVSGIGEPTI